MVDVLFIKDVLREDFQWKYEQETPREPTNGEERWEIARNGALGFQSKIQINHNSLDVFSTETTGRVKTTGDMATIRLKARKVRTQAEMHGLMY